VVRSDEYKQRLLDFIDYAYSLKAIDIIPSKRGFYGETWRLETKDNRYFLKLVYAPEHKHIYERSFPIIQYLCSHGIDFISSIIKTKNGGLSSQFDDAILGIFNWIDGELIETDATKSPEYQMLAKVYSIPTNGIIIPHEDFSEKYAVKFFNQWKALKDNATILLLEKNHIKIKHRADRLKHFANLLTDDTTNYFITHGDAGGNLIKNGDKYHIVDWDNPLLAPPERDAWVMCYRDWAMDTFHESLYNNNIKYTLQKERLAYYCYQFFFYYLTAFLDAYAPADVIEDYINGWIKDSFAYADTI